MSDIVTGIRGATSVVSNTKEEILMRTKELLLEIVNQNKLDTDNIASAFFTMTEDLDSTFPAEAARSLGWTHIALLCAREINVPGSLKKCIRVLVHYNSDSGFKPKHVYLHEAKSLREDLVQNKQKGEKRS